MSEVEQVRVRGSDVVRLRSEYVQVDVVPGLGGAVTSIRRAADDFEVLYQPPWGLPAASAPALPGSASERSFDADTGGWQSLFPNGGDEATVDGVTWAPDGEARVSWFDHRLGDDGELIMTCRLRRSPFTLQKTIAVIGSTVRLSEQITHHGRRTAEVMWGSRVRFGAELSSSAAVIDCGAALVHPDSTMNWDADYDDITPWPRAAGSGSMINLRSLPEADDRQDRLVYLTEFDSGWLTVTNASAGCAVRLDWDAEQWPHLWYELQNGADDDHPWFGTERFLALAPGSSWPAHGLHEARRVSGTALTLAPGEQRSASLALTIDPVDGPVG